MLIKLIRHIAQLSFKHEKKSMVLQYNRITWIPQVAVHVQPQHGWDSCYAPKKVDTNWGTAC